jgi:hypothetical protein
MSSRMISKMVPRFMACRPMQLVGGAKGWPRQHQTSHSTLGYSLVTSRTVSFTPPTAFWTLPATCSA